MAWVLAAMGRWREARRYALRAARYGTQDPELQYHAGVIAWHTGHARRSRRGCVRRSPPTPRFHPFYADDARRMLAVLGRLRCATRIRASTLPDRPQRRGVGTGVPRILVASRAARHGAARLHVRAAPRRRRRSHLRDRQRHAQAHAGATAAPSASGFSFRSATRPWSSRYRSRSPFGAAVVKDALAVAAARRRARRHVGLGGVLAARRGDQSRRAARYLRRVRPRSSRRDASKTRAR